MLWFELGMVVYAYNSSLTLEAETGGSQVQSQAALNGRIVYLKEGGREGKAKTKSLI